MKPKKKTDKGLSPKDKRKFLDHVEKKYGVDFGVKTDEELFKRLEREGLSSLVILIRKLHPTQQASSRL